MPNATNSLLIAAAILFVITLSDPCVNTIFAMLRRAARRQIEADDGEAVAQPEPSYKRDAA